MLLLGTVLAGGLYSMWQSSIEIFSLERDSLQAFYLAQAAIERAKIATLYDFWSTGTHNRPITGNATEDPDGDGFFEDLAIAFVPNYRYQYNFRVVNPGGTQRQLTGRGRVLDGADRIVAVRSITLTIDGISDTAPADGVDDYLTGTVVARTWREQ